LVIFTSLTYRDPVCCEYILFKHVTHTITYIILNEYTYYHSVKILYETANKKMVEEIKKARSVGRNNRGVDQQKKIWKDGKTI